MIVKLLATALLCTGVISATNAQSDTTHRQRRANAIDKFFVGVWGAFDRNWSQNPADQHFGKFGDTDNYRFVNLEDSLGLNAEIRKFWDYPTSPFPAHRDTVLGGKLAPMLDVLGIEPVQLYLALDNAQYMRFEFERHSKQTAPTEYPGFLHRPGLVGRNVIAAGATMPPFLAGTSRATDTNAIELNVNTDNAGVFADSMWHNELYKNNNGTPHANFMMFGLSRKMLLRIRVKVSQRRRDTNAILLIVTRREERDSATVRKVDVDTIRVNRRFRHVNTALYDTIDIPFIRDTATNQDAVHKIFFSFYWPKKVHAIFDYMELMTARIHTTDLNDSVYVGGGNIGTDGIRNGLFATYSAEAFLDSIPVELGKLISSIKQQYLGHINYVRLGDEFPMAIGLPFKRIVKLFRDSTGGQIEVVPFTVDSGTGWFGQSLPNAHEFNFEGARRGWVDTHYFADPRMIFFDPYKIENHFPLPRRTVAATNLKDWEVNHMPSNLPNHYTREEYLKIAQYLQYHEYLEFNRSDRRWAERQGDSTRYGILWQAGAHPELDGRTMKFKVLRPPTGAEMKVTGHLATSCGAAGLLLYLIGNPGHGIPGPNGGIMMADGTHDSMYYTTFIGNDTGRIWMGFKERYDSVRKLIPTLKTYGTALLSAKRIGDWKASEFNFAPDSLLPFSTSSVRTIDDALRIDTLRRHDVTDTVDLTIGGKWWLHPDIPLIADTANRTFVHISVWLDTVGGKNDTMLYITNMRTDDSYGTTEVPSTIDRRYVTLKLKKQHYVVDMMEPDIQPRMNDKLRTPFVGTPNSYTLTLRLLPGDGILVKLQ